MLKFLSLDKVEIKSFLYQLEKNLLQDFANRPYKRAGKNDIFKRRKKKKCVYATNFFSPFLIINCDFLIYQVPIATVVWYSEFYQLSRICVAITAKKVKL